MWGAPWTCREKRTVRALASPRLWVPPGAPGERARERRTQRARPEGCPWVGREPARVASLAVPPTPRTRRGASARPARRRRSRGPRSSEAGSGASRRWRASQGMRGTSSPRAPAPAEGTPPPRARSGSYRRRPRPPRASPPATDDSPWSWPCLSSTVASAPSRRRARSPSPPHPGPDETRTASARIPDRTGVRASRSVGTYYTSLFNHRSARSE